MKCTNHPEKEAIDRCVGCADAFCPNCLVEIQGESYCGSCKVMTLDEKVIPDQASYPCEAAGSALKYGIFSLFCFGFILGPIAIHTGMKAKKEILNDPSLTGSGKATAGIILGVIALALWILGLIGKMMEFSSTQY